MNTYYFTGQARQRGAIGIVHPFSDRVTAETVDAARVQLYDRWEHIRIEEWRQES